MLRLLLTLASLLLLAAACAGGGPSHRSPPRIIVSPLASATPTPTATPLPATPTPTPTPSPTPSPSPTPTPPPPALELSASFPRQGGFLLVSLLDPPPGLTEATVQFAGGSYPMLPEGDRWYAVIGLGTWFPTGDYPLEVTAEASLASATLSIEPGGFEQEYIELPPESVGLLADAAAIEEERRILGQVYAGFTPERLWSGAWILPAEGPITDPFGLQRSINGGPFSPHSGTDIAAEAGTPAVAAASGRVALAAELYLYGNAVVIDHGAGVFSSYNHLDTIAVTQGQSVTAGDLLGYVGETGFVSGPHLHWEAIIGGVRVDPTLWTFAPVEP